jgi:hypothetical protein
MMVAERWTTQPKLQSAGMERRECCREPSGKMCAGMDKAAERGSDPAPTEEMVAPLGRETESVGAE